MGIENIKKQNAIIKKEEGGNEEKAKQVYTDTEPLQAHDIADTVAYCANLPAHVCINDLVITCTAQGNSTTIFKRFNLKIVCL